MDTDMAPAPAEGEAVQAPPLETLSTSILLHVRQVQAEHGLKHADYTRYRQYCSKRAHKLYSSLKILHGRGRYVKKELAAEHYTTDKHMHVPLLNAERAWATSMEMKHAEGKKTAGSRHYMLLKLSKADKWARELARVAVARCDARTALEAEAYASMMGGNLILEAGKDWASALTKFRRAESVLAELVKDGSFEQQGICRQYLKELEPTMRFCKYQMERDGSGEAEKGGAPSSPNLKALAAKLSKSAEADGASEEQGAEEAKAMTAFLWRGISYPIAIEKVASMLGTAAQKLTTLKEVMETDDVPDPRIAVYDQVLQLYNEARQLVYSTHIAGDQASALKEEAEGLVQSLDGHKLELQLVRGRLAIADMRKRLKQQQMRSLAGKRAPQAPEDASAAPSKSKAKQRPVKAEDLVRMYDGLDGVVTELADLANHLPAAQSEQLIEECTVHSHAIKAGQLVYLAAASIHRGKHQVAVAATREALSNASEARDGLEIFKERDMLLEEEISMVEQLSQAQASVAKAEWYNASANTSDAASLARLDIAEAAHGDSKSSSSGSHLMECLDQWKACAGSSKADMQIAPVPPSPMIAPVRPFTLDAALNFIDLPPMDHLYTKTKESKSTFSRLFGGWSS